ncbi:protein of unknown function [Variovorax sp. YR266]|uniref:nuclear transport factor 2 family protein n=1 Tax=Variovorax sp. YR266 TaxID=1884386 RepID=UPI0008962063|nr:nuclear transport factor 2 family protein [Variovorax sp. YR266]SDY35560.1 protein of unknown function [Variovorax sp. YR266]
MLVRNLVAECSAARMKALMDGDIECLSALLADGLRYVHATGVSHDRAGYLQFVRERLKFLDVHLESRVIKVFGACAVVTGRLCQRIVRAGESEPVTLSSWAIEVWEHTDGWRLVDFQSTRLSAEPLAQSSQKKSLT